MVEIGHTVHHRRPMNKKSLSNPGHQTAQTSVLAILPMSVVPAIRHKIIMVENTVNIGNDGGFDQNNMVFRGNIWAVQQVEIKLKKHP